MGVASDHPLAIAFLIAGALVLVLVIVLIRE